MKYLLVLLAFVITTTTSAQNFPQCGFTYSGEPKLSSVGNFAQYDGQKSEVFQSIIQKESGIIVYRIIATPFKEKITATEIYYSGLKQKYEKLGATSFTTLDNNKAVKVVEDVYIEGIPLKQISIATLHQNKSITAVLLTNYPNYNELMSNYINKISLLSPPETSKADKPRFAPDRGFLRGTTSLSQ